MLRLLASILAALSLGALASSVAAPPDDVEPRSEWFGVATARVDSLIDGGYYAAADSLLRTWDARLDAAVATPSEDSAFLTSLRGEVAWRLGRGAEADSLLRLTVDQKRAVYGDRSLEVASSTRALASFLSGRADGCEAAAAKVREAVEIFEEVGGPDHEEIPLALAVAAICHARAGEYAEARPLFEEVATRSIAAHGEGDLRVADALQNLGSIEYVLTDYEAARERYVQALQIYRRHLDPTSGRMIGILSNLGNTQTTVGDYANALRSYEEAQQAANANGMEESSSVTTLILGSGSAQLLLGNIEEAEDLFRRCLEILARLDDRKPDVEASCLSKLGSIEVARGNYERGVALLRESLALYEDALGPDHDFTGHVIFDLARALRLAGQLQEARDLSERLLAMRLAQHGADGLRVAEARRGLGRVLMDRGEWREAKTQFETALSSFDASMRLSPLYLSLCLEYARVLEHGGDPKGALEQLDLAADLQRQSIRDTATALSESQALQYQSTGRSALERLIELASSPELGEAELERIWTRVASSRALVLDEMTRRLRLLREHPEPGVQELVAQLADVEGRLSSLYLRHSSSSPSSRERALQSLSRRKERLERKLALELGSDRVLKPAEALDAGALRRALPRSGGLVSFVTTGPPEAERLGVFYLADRDAPVRFLDLGAAAPVDSLVSTWLREARGSTTHPSIARRHERGAREAGAELRERVLDPVLRRMPEARRVTIVPAGSLHLVSWLALPDDHGGYLAESGPLFETLNTERELVRDDASWGSGLLAMGDPDFQSAGSGYGDGEGDSTNRNLRRTCVDLELTGFTALPGARREVRNLADEWNRRRERKLVEGEAWAEVGSRASEQVLREESRGRRVVHVATHGFFLATPCEGMAEASTRSAPFEPVQSEIARSNPLLLSGLALAGADAPSLTARNDGIFTAEEMSTLDLEGVEWFVLSGCDTGQGTVESSEGVFGMRRALSVAGARTVIMSLWPVNDTTARLWMESLYRSRFDEGMSTPEAVRAASLALLEQRRQRGLPTPPSTWAPFQASGR